MVALAETKHKRDNNMGKYARYHEAECSMREIRHRRSVHPYQVISSAHPDLLSRASANEVHWKPTFLSCKAQRWSNLDLASLIWNLGPVTASDAVTFHWGEVDAQTGNRILGDVA